MSSRSRSIAIGLILAGIPFAAPAIAAEPESPPAANASPSTDQLEEIVVTAEKRSEALDKVPISITAIDQATLDKQGVKDVTDIARLVPGLNLQTSDELGDTNISIRGIVSDTGAETTGVYIDDTPVQVRQEIVSSNPYPKIFDLDHVEVLRGPQGTLFGAGSEGGTIRFITPEPGLQTYSGYARSELAFTLGGAPSYELGGAVGGPIVPGVLGFRGTAWYREDGGYTTRIDPVTGETEATDANGADSKVFKLGFKLAPTDDLIVMPSIYYQDLHSADRSEYWESAGLFNELAQIPQPHSDKFVLPSLNVEYDFPVFSIKSISSFFKRDVNDSFDATAFELSGLIPYNGQDYGGITVPGYPNYFSHGMYHETQQNWTEELRFTSTDDPNARLSWVGGFYWQHNIAGSDSLFQEPFNDVAAYLTNYYCANGYPDYCGASPTSLAYFGEAPVDGRYSYLDHFKGREQDEALYGNVTYEIVDNLKASAGLRLARSTFDYIDYQDGPYGPAAPQTNSGSETETPVTPRFNLTYQLTPDQMIYATAAKGYRIGGANEAIPADICHTDLASLDLTQGPLTYQSDSVWSYEVGAKGTFLDNHLELESSIFWIDWSNIQQQVYLPSCGYYYTGNLGTAVSRGFDLQAEWSVGGGWVLSGTAGLTDARYTKTTSVNGAILAQSGDSLATPEWSATAAAQYNFKVRDQTNGYARLDYQFSGPYYRTGSADTFSYNALTRKAPATHYFSTRVGVTQGGWDVSFFIDNLFNVHPSLYRYQDTVYSPDLRDLTFRPFTAGVTAEYKF